MSQSTRLKDISKGFPYRFNSIELLQNTLSCSLSRLVNVQKRFVRPAVFRFVSTWRCNCSCTMCGIHGLEAKQREIPGSDLGAMLGENRPAFENVRKLVISGGEPFLREDLAGVIQTICENCPGLREIGIATNGSLTQKTMEDVEILLKNIRDVRLILTVSLDGIGDIHDQIRGHKNLFEKAVITINQLKTLAKTSPKLQVTSQVTYSNSNIGTKHEIERFLRKKNIPFSYDFAQIVDPLYSNKGKDIDMLERNVQKTIFERSNFIDFYIHKQIEERKRYLPCPAPYNFFSLSPDGGIISCVKSGVIGNLYNDSLTDVLDCARVEKNHLEILEQDLCSECYFTCGLDWTLYSDLSCLMKMGFIQLFLLYFGRRKPSNS